MLNALGYPNERDIDSNICFKKISEDEELTE
jgi:hypothetical protein